MQRRNAASFRSAEQEIQNPELSQRHELNRGRGNKEKTAEKKLLKDLKEQGEVKHD